jgi:hypothetical protein
MRALAAASLLVLSACAATDPGAPPFCFVVVDAATGRGVPLVELETVNGVVHVTDNAGVAVVEEPGLEGQEVWFFVRSHGYRVAADGFGYRGVRATVVRGGRHTLAIERVNVAERLYRVTGAGLYRDSALAGLGAPLREPLLDGGVLGQDSVVNAVYGGRLCWFWGDTNRAEYPLGNFAVAGAWSALPEHGGLPPATGVDLHYFTGDDGFARPMCPLEGPGPVWIDGLMVLRHAEREVMLCHYARMQDLGVRHEHGIARWSDEQLRFEKIAELPLETRLHPAGHPLRAAGADGEWLYFPNPYPALRVAARLEDVLRPARYEAYTCLLPGARFDQSAPALARDAGGALSWGWRADTDPVSPSQWEQMVRDGHVRDGEGWMSLADPDTGERVVAHGGSVCWNEYRQRWIMIALQAGGSSFLGEVWYAEAPELLGPWQRARKVVTHDRYSFYNVKQHPYFDGDGGRFVYFECTYTKAFSGQDHATPRYDYNQVMYRLDLSDERLWP